MHCQKVRGTSIPPACTALGQNDQETTLLVLRMVDKQSKAAGLRPGVLFRPRATSSSAFERSYARLRRKLMIKHRLGIGLEARTPYENVYYCCTQRTGSQTLRAVFQHETFWRWSGLRVEPYFEVGLRSARADERLRKAFARHTLACHLYVDYPTYQSIPKPSRYKTFFVMRDPRDAVVSFYYAALVSHTPVGVIPRMRADLQPLDKRAGLRYVIDSLDELGFFEAQRSWASAEADADENVRVFRYEDRAANESRFLRELLDYLEVPMPEEELGNLSSRFSFETVTGGRPKGKEDISHHLRKGTPGDWRAQFDDEILAYFADATQDLVQVLGYDTN